MKHLLGRMWSRWLLPAFVTGMFALLPVVITVLLMGWVGGMLVRMVGPQTVIGGLLREIGLRFVTDPTVATVVGWLLVLLGIWTLGVCIQVTARHRIDAMFHTLMHRLPLVGAIYKPVSQVVRLLQREAQEDMQEMTVVFCTFSEYGGAGVLGLLASFEPFRIGAQDYRLVYIPTAPVPMTGGLVFVPANTVTPVNISVDDLLKICFSLGILSSQVMPALYRTSRPAQGEQERV